MTFIPDGTIDPWIRTHKDPTSHVSILRDRKQRAIVFQFGEAVRPDIPVGFHFKLPIIQDVKKYDARIQTLDEEPDRILTVESKYLLVDSFIKYRITDVLTFYKANHLTFNGFNIYI